jgi:hypothetical protein
MSRQAIKTNNDASTIDAKISLRIDSISTIMNPRVLELFGGEGVLWNEVSRITKKPISILSIDKKKYNRVQLQGDNLKFIDQINLQDFDVIDIDAYSSPVKQLKKIFEKNYKGIVHATFIQTMFGALDRDMLRDIGYTPDMVKKIPSLFNKDGLSKMEQFLAQNGVTEMKIYAKGKKNYFYFVLQ